MQLGVVLAVFILKKEHVELRILQQYYGNMMLAVGVGLITVITAFSVMLTKFPTSSFNSQARFTAL